MGRYPPYKLLVLAANDWHDKEFLHAEFKRLASLHRKIKIIFPDDTCAWQLYIRDWCIQNPEQFIADGYRKDVFRVGKKDDFQRDWKMFWDGNPDEVWRIESSKGCKGRPDFALWPHLWKQALDMNMTCVTFRSPYRKKKPWNPDYMVPAMVVRKRKIK